MVVEQISVVPRGDGRWAVKHGEGFLGAAGGREEAIGIGRHLVQWLSTQGRPAELHVEHAGSPTR